VEPEDVITALNKSQPQDTQKLAERFEHSKNFINSNLIFVIVPTNVHIYIYNKLLCYKCSYIY